jgi:beta-lactamase class A
MSPVLLFALLAPAQPTLESRLAPLIEAHKGKVAVGVKNLTTGETWYHNGDAVMPTASLIKVAVLVEAYMQADEGKVNLRDKVILREADKVPGSGVLAPHFSDGASFSLRDAVRLMIAASDNTATNLVLDRVGIANVNKRMAEWGCPETRINAKVFRGSTTSVDKARTNKYGLGSTTAKEMVKLFEKIQTNDGVRPALKLVMLEHLKKNDDKDKFSSLLPPGIVVAHKDGSVSDSRTDAGLLFTPAGVLVVCVLTTGNADRRWERDNAGNVLCAKVARAVYDHYNSPGKGPKDAPGTNRDE